MKLRNLKFKEFAITIRTRLHLVLGLLSAMLVVGAAVGLGGMQLQNDDAGKVYNENIVPFELISHIAVDHLLSFTYLSEAATLIGKKDQLNAKLANYQKLRDEMAQLKKQYAAIPMNDNVKKAYDAWNSTNGDYLDALSSAEDAIKQGDSDATDIIQMQVRPLMMERKDALEKNIALHRDDAQADYQRQVSLFHLIRIACLIGVIAGLIIATMLALSLIRSILSALSTAVTVSNKIAGGQLGNDIKIHGKNELSELLSALRAMDERLTGIVAEVRDGAHSVSTAAQQISRGNDDLSQRTQEQASSLEETASSMEQMTSTVKQNAENASHANQLAQGARDQAEHGGKVAAQAMSAMKEISESSRKIADIVNLIDEIAFQTNLLSLNAAVEAAHAGEQGKGFAVVAAEVRNLAQRSAGAAKEIKALIKDSADKVQTGSALVDQSGKALTDIVDSVKKVSDVVAEIAAASNEQSAGIEQVNNAVLQMDEMTQQNAALVEEAAAAARSMQDQAGELARQVGFFHLNGNVAAASANTSKAHAHAHATDTASEAEATAVPTRKFKPAPTKTPALETADTSTWKEF